MVDHNDYRLAFAHQCYGVTPINFDDNDDPAEWIIENTAGNRGGEAVIDAVGFEAKGSITETVLTTLKIESSSGKALRQCIAAVRRGGIVSVPGVHAWLPDLLALIEQGHLKPEEIITHHLPLADAARGYEIFDKRQEMCRKVILVPGMAAQQGTSGLSGGS